MQLLRVRVAWWIGVAILLTVVCLLVLLRIGFRYVLLQELDSVLRHEANELIVQYEQGRNDSQKLLNAFTVYEPPSDGAPWFGALLDAHGKVVFTTPAAPQPLPRVSHMAAGEPVSNGPYRLLQLPVEPGTKSPHAVLVGTSLHSFQKYLQEFDRYSLLSGVGVLGMASVIGYFMAGVAVKPVADFVLQAEQLQIDVARQRLAPQGKINELDRLAVVTNRLLERITTDASENRHLLADAAHQLRTPLAAIRSSVEVALAGNQDPATYEELLAQVVDETQSLEALVNQLLMLTETDAPRTTLARENVAFDKLVQKSVDMFEPVAESNGVTIWVSTLARAEVLGNRHHLRQVINNLLENALKFTAAKSGHERRQITVELTTDPQQHLAQLRVVDTGIGIGREHLARIFDRFYRADSARSREQGVAGNGLGLSIVKAVVESHGGSVHVESTLGAGTTMLITLPLTVRELAA